MPFGWLVYLLWVWFYDSQVKTALMMKLKEFQRLKASEAHLHQTSLKVHPHPPPPGVATNTFDGTLPYRPTLPDYPGMSQI